jgi:hypothetical protein
MTDKFMYQQAPYPVMLAELVWRLRPRPGWSFRLDDIDRGQGSKGLTLIINITGPDTYHPESTVSVDHYMIVPAAAFDGRSWRRWLFEQIRLVSTHEDCEWFAFRITSSDGMVYETLDRPYAPSHGPGNDPYLIREVGTAEDVRTSFLGERAP